MEESIIPGTLELPTLGRSMRLGTFYDLRSDEVITTGVTLSNKENAGEQLKVVEQKGYEFNIIRSDVFNEKSVALGLDASLKASVLAGLVQAEAGSKYLYDRQPLDSRCRLTLHVKTTNKFEYLMQEALEAVLKGKTPEVFAQVRATHVVKSILYGSNTFIVLDYCGGDEKENASKVLTDLVDKIAANVKEGDGIAAGWDHHVRWKVYSDLPLERNPADVEGFVQFLTAMPEISKVNAIPIKVFLYPLSKIDPRSARVCSAVSDSLPSQAQSFLEGIEDCLMRSHEMANDPISKSFPQLKEKFEFFIHLLTEYKSSYKKELARVLPLIRSGSDGEGCIKDMFRDVDSSSFNLTSLNAWVQSKRKELSAVQLYVRFLPEVEIVTSRESLDDILMDPSIETVVCFTFQLKGKEEGYLTALSEYIVERKRGSYEEINWYDDRSLLKDMRLNAKLFGFFFKSNTNEDCTKFIATGFEHAISGSSEGKSGGTVNLFEQGMLNQEDFQPPSQPLKPQCDVIDQHSVTLTWTQPEYGLSNVQRYAVKYNVFHGQNKETGELRAMQTESLETLVTIDNLEPNQSIQYQVSAVCTAGVGPESERSAVATTLSAKSPEKPEFRNVTASCAILMWKQHGKMGKDEVVESYIIQLMEVGNMSKEVDTKSSKKEFRIKHLEPNTTYTFQVVALYESGIKSPPSTISDQCTTRPASQPGKPAVSDIKSSSVVITWTDPTTVGLGVELTDHFIEYCKTANRKQSAKSANGAWEKILLKENGKGGRPFLVSDLDPNTTYVARVTLVYRVKKGKEPEMIASVNSDHFTTLPAGPPMGLKARQVSASQIEINWTEPTVVGTEVKHYKVEYRSDDDPKVVKRKTDDPSCKFVIKGVKSKTRYNINVFGFCGNAGPGEVSNVECTTRKLIKQDVIQVSEILQPGDPDTGKPTTFKLPLNKVCEKSQSRSYSFGEGSKIQREHKVIMVVGVTGSGKSTLINAMVNNILEIERNDEYRFKVVDVGEGNGTSQAHSQTQVLTSYTLMDENLHLPYDLTIIDTPGFGDTRGIQRDKAIFEQIREFFLGAESHRIDHIDAIGFVVQASEARLTPTQEYVFDSILSVFGKDIADNIILLVTFADGKQPPVLAAVKEADIPFTGKCFKFNNSALFAEVRRPNHQDGDKTSNRKDHEKIDTMFWDMGSKSLKAFFKNVQTLPAQSLRLTKEVLEERKRLEIAVQGLQPQIMVGNCKYEALRKEHQILEQYEAEIEANKDFNFKLKVPRSRKVDITGEYITNCNKCHFTCHYPCGIADDAMKASCAAMKDGVCTACPGECAWDVHFNQQYRFEYYEEEEEKTYEEIEKRYRDASGKKLTVKQVIQKHIDDLKKVRTNVFALIAKSHKSVTRLEEIALKPNPLSTVEYINLLIESEKRSGKPGWQDRVSGLEDVRKEADIIGKVKNAKYNPFKKMDSNITVIVDKKKGWLPSWLS